MIDCADLSQAQVITWKLITDNIKETLPIKVRKSPEAKANSNHLSVIVSLCLSRKNLHEVMNLEYLSNLRILRMDNNYLDSLRGLENLPNLEWLDVSYNSITNISVQVGDFKSLKNLNLSSNKISSLSFHTDSDGPNQGILPCLNSLSLGNNSIADSSAFKTLNYLAALVYIDIEENPCFSGQETGEAFIRKNLPSIKTLNSF